MVDPSAQAFLEFIRRRRGLVEALTFDLDKFLARCDPEADWLCLSVSMDGWFWDVTVPPPAPDVPPERNEPAPGVIFKRDLNIPLSDWLLQIALLCDTWLKSVAAHRLVVAHLDNDEEARDDLFTHIKNYSIIQPVEQHLGRVFGRNESQKPDESTGQDMDEACMSCSGLRYSAFWIKCHMCKKTYHGDCIQITPSMAASMDQYKCRYCRRSSLAVDIDL